MWHSQFNCILSNFNGVGSKLKCTLPKFLVMTHNTLCIDNSLDSTFNHYVRHVISQIYKFASILYYSKINDLYLHSWYMYMSIITVVKKDIIHHMCLCNVIQSTFESKCMAVTANSDHILMKLYYNDNEFGHNVLKTIKH